MSVERASRLRRYLRKDYTQIVEFPVEIIGRDGQVRRYSFDDSVRLYHRRIRSAPMRYDDSELIDAETRHCRQRIDQLRRSYLEHFGWGALRTGELGGLFATPLGAEVVSFLRRVFGSERPSSLALTPIQTESAEAWYLSCSVRKRSFILYAFRLDLPGARDAYRATLRQFAQVPPGPGVERLFTVHEGPDLALLLAGEGEWDGPVLGTAPDEGLVGDTASAFEDGDLWTAGLRALHDGAIAEAVRTFEHGMEQQPLRACFPQAAAVVAMLDNQPERAEFAARYGTLQHPEDPVLRYLLAVAVSRAGRFKEAAEVLPATTDFPLAGGVRALLALRAGRLVEAWRQLAAVPRHDPRDERFVARTAERLRVEVVAGALAALVGGIALLLLPAAVYVVDAGSPALGLAAAAVACATLGVAGVVLVRLRRRAAASLTGRGQPDLRLVSIELLPRESSGVH